MRLIGHLDNEAYARLMGDVFVTRGIPCLLEPDAGAWAVWVHAEDDLPQARELFAAFRANPNDPSFRAAAGSTAAQEAQERGGTGGPRVVRGREVLMRPDGPALGVLTIALIVLCGVVALWTRLDERGARVAVLQISEYVFDLRRGWATFLPEVRVGQVWRLVTPILLHFTVLHIVFNLWCLWGLGNAIEFRFGSGRLAALVAVTGVFSNLLQYVAAGPGFGGMSGVVYGLLGYVWMLGRYRPGLGLALTPQTVTIMLVWFVLGMTDLLGQPIANWAHGGGLLVGMIWGRIEAARG